MITVKATREGLIGQMTASGYIIDRVVPFIALPSHKALGKFVRLTNPLNQKTALAVVLEVGPWNEHDENYVFQPATQPSGLEPDQTIRPLAEQGASVSGKGTNTAGIDLGEVIWHQLGMTDNTNISWEFVE